MSWTMGDREALLSLLANPNSAPIPAAATEAAAAKAVADALLRTIARQAIIAAAADAVAALGGGCSTVTAGLNTVINPGGGQGDDGPNSQDPPDHP